MSEFIYTKFDTYKLKDKEKVKSEKLKDKEKVKWDKTAGDYAKSFGNTLSGIKVSNKGKSPYHKGAGNKNWLRW